MGSWWALGFRDVSGSGDYVPDTLLEGDIRNNIHATYRIIATYIKTADEERFTQIVYHARKIEYDRLVYPQDWGNRPTLAPEIKESMEESTAQETSIVEVQV